MTAAASVLWSAAEAAEATGGVVASEWQATGVSIDSRSVRPGDLFTALKGPNFDGLAFVAAALEGGAAAAMVERTPDGLAAGAPLLVVPDTFEGLERLGAAGRARAKARVIAVTGSVGKTSVKEALAFVLGRQAKTGSSAGSFNNQFGVPLSLARLAPDAAYGVFELGMNHAGELTPLTRLVRPHVALITTIEPAHMEFFASLAEVAAAKAEIFAGLEPGGVAVLNRDNAYFDQLAEAARAAGATVVGFGRHAEADYRLIAATTDADGSEVEMIAAGKRLAYRVAVAGKHWVINSLAVLAAADAAGADVKQAAADLADLAPAARRGERHMVRIGGTCFEVIDDSYNASPAAIAAALGVLAAARPGPSGRRIAVLGDMLELGGDSAALHAGLAGAVAEAGTDLVFTVGDEMRRLSDALPEGTRGAWTATSDEMAPIVAAAVGAGDVVLVKGSAGMRMDRVVEALKGLGAAAGRASAG